MPTKSTTKSTPSVSILDVLNAWSDADAPTRDAQTAAASARIRAASPAVLVSTVTKSDGEFAVDPLAHDAAVVQADKALSRTLRKALADRVKVDATRAGESLAHRMLGSAR